MEYERKGVTITWKIKNIKYLQRSWRRLISPAIKVEEMDGTMWKLGLNNTPFSRIHLFIKREEIDDGPEQIGLDYEISVNTRDGKLPTVQCMKKPQSLKFSNGFSCHEIPFYSGLYLCNSSPITVQCRMWRQQGSISNNLSFDIETPISVGEWEFVGVVENFSRLSVGDERTLKTVSSSKGKELMIVTLNLLPQPHQQKNYLQIGINCRDNETTQFFNFDVWCLTSSGNKYNKYRDNSREAYSRFHIQSSTRFTLAVTKENLLEDAALFLPNDTLSLYCKITLYDWGEHKMKESIECESNSVSETTQAGFLSAVVALTANHGFPCDVEVQTNTQTFPAHTEVLSAQSALFEAMFRSSMKEAIRKSVRIDDVDSETVKRLLVFLYSDTMEKMEWKDAVKLYIAADKYQILSLKQKCSDFLGKNINLSNCCVLLRLADLHQDNDLKTNTQIFVAENMPQILYCEQWKDLERNLPQLAIESCHNITEKEINRLQANVPNWEHLV